MKKKLLFISTLIVLVMLNLVTAFYNNQTTLGNAAETQSHYSKTISYNQAVQKGKPIVITFYTDWCGYCKKAAPVIETLRKEYSDKYTFVNANAEAGSNAQLANKFKVKSYPSLYLVDPATNKVKFINQRSYVNKEIMENELNNFLGACLAK